MNELVIRAIFSLPKILLWKFKYGGRLTMPLVQSFGKHAELHLDKKARVSIGKETVSRFGLFLRAFLTLMCPLPVWSVSALGTDARLPTM